MRKILVIDDEPTLRTSMQRGLSRMPATIVREAGNMEGALREIDREVPDVIVSDIDLPDRLGIELLGELGKRGLSVPVIFVSAYLKAFRAQIPRHGDYATLEKPVSLEKLREVVQEKLKGPQSGSPFSVPDYLQLSCMGRHSVKIAATAPDGRVGHIVISEGEPWCARFGDLSGAEAFAAICFEPELAVACEGVDGRFGEKNLSQSVDALLMEAARLFDEANRNMGDATATLHPGRRPRNDAIPPSVSPREPRDAPPSDEPTPGSDPVLRMFQQHWEAGVDALLARNFEVALEEFQTAQTLNPDDRKVAANIKRLKDMGIQLPAHEEPS